MSIRSVSAAQHAHLRWRRYSDFRFAGSTVLAPLSAPEIGPAALAFPLAFVRQGEHWVLSAVLGLLTDQCLFVDPNGGWLGGYVPAVIRGHPFLIGAKPGGAPTLCFDDSSGLLTGDPQGELFYEVDGQLSLTLKQISNFLSAAADGQNVAMQGCDRLVRAGMVEAWPITIQSDSDAVPVRDLFRVNEAALNSLDANTLAELARGGLLALAFAQLLSMGHLPRLGQLAQARAQAEAAERAREPLKPLLELPLDSNEIWDWSKVGR